MKRNLFSTGRIAAFIFPIGAFVIDSAGQSAEELEFIETAESSGWWYLIYLLAAAALGGAYYLWKKSKKGKDRPRYNYDSRYANYYKNESYDMEGVDAEKELEWLRKAKKSTGRPEKLTFGTAPKLKAAPGVKTAADPTVNLDAKMFQEKMRKLQYAQLPINSFTALTPSKLYDPLPLSNDQSLLNAVDQANEEFEEDESVRDLAVRILAAFRTRNAVEALSQIALYDLSSALRSKAVSILTDFDHDSVFEAILLACADPTREVRAAAARGLFRLNFDRADAWKRIIETNDEFRMSHAARAAIESGIVVKSFDRLVHEDLKVTYEAFALVSLLIKSGETNEIFDAIRSHKDERVKFALLHVLKVQKDPRTLAALYDVQTKDSLPTDVSDRVRDTISSFDQVMA